MGVCRGSVCPAIFHTSAAVCSVCPSLSLVGLAQVIALAASIGEHIASPAEKLLVPPLRVVLKDNGVKEEWAAVAVRCTSI